MKYPHRPKNYEPGMMSSTTVPGSSFRRLKLGSSMKSPGPPASHKNLAPPRGKGTDYGMKMGKGKSHNSGGSY